MSLEKVIQAIDQHRTFFIATHQSPDADGIGSALALALFIRKAGKECTVVSTDPIPKNLQFLPYKTIFKQQARVTEWPEVMFALDCGDLGRMGYFEKGAKPVPLLINIDHHVTNKAFGTINWVDHQAAATGELIYELILGSGGEITEEIALCLYTTLVTETGFFAYSNTRPKTFELAAIFLGYGVDPWKVSERLRESSPQRLLLLAELLRGLKRSEDGQVAWMTVTPDLFKKTGTTSEDTEEMIAYPRSLAGVEVAVLFRELDEGNCKVSLRSKNRIDVAQLAEHFGGGGHSKAAGCTISGTLSEVKERVLAAVENVVKEGVKR